MSDVLATDRPVRPDLVATDPPALIGARCERCGKLSFPRENHCPHCGTPDPSPTTLPTTGTVFSYTIVRFAAPGYTGPVPYAVGIVELEGAIRVASTLLAERLESLVVGAPVRFTALEVPTDDGPVASYAYALERA